MASTIDIKEHMEVIGADGAFVGRVDKVEGDRIKLTKDDGRGGKRDHHHFLSVGLVAGVEGDKVRLSATAANALTLQEEEAGTPVNDEASGAAGRSAFAFEDQDADATVSGRSRTFETRAPQAAPKANYETARTDHTSAVKYLGVGAAALGGIVAAAFGAAKLLNQRGEERAHLSLEEDENVRLISSTKVEGTPVLDRSGLGIGTVESVMLDKYSGRIGYAILRFGSTFGYGGSLFPLPWSALKYDVEKDGYRLRLTKEQLKDAPRFEANDAPEFDAAYGEQVTTYYRRR